MKTNPNSKKQQNAGVPLSFLEKLCNKLHIATYSKDAIDMAKNFGLGIELNHVCISELLDADKIEETIKWIKSDLESADLPFPATKNAPILLHGPFTEIVPGAMDHRAVDLALQRMEEAYELCMKIGVDRMIVHSGYFPPMYYKEWHHEKSLIFWDKFLQGKDNFTVYVENSFEDEPFMMAKLMDDFNKPNLKLCLDVGHANVTTPKDFPVEKWIEHLGSRVAHYHIHNNMGTKDTHSSLGDGTMDMSSILRAIAQNNSSAYTLTLESQDCSRCIKWLSSHH